MIKSITPLQWIGIIILFNGTLIGGSSYLADLLLNPPMVKGLIALASLVNMFLGGLVTMFSSQGAQVKQVLAMPGVERVTVNAQANQTLSAMAVDPTVNKIAPEQKDIGAITQTAKGN